MLYVETYRPKTLDGCILPERLVSKFKTMTESKDIPNSLFVGPPGSGKTTVAKVLQHMVDTDILVVNASDERGIDVLRTRVKQFGSVAQYDGKKSIIFLDEADYLTPEAQAALRGMIEDLSSNCVFILACNYPGRLIPELHSRLSTFDFSLSGPERKEMAKAFYNHAKRILKAEHVNFETEFLQRIILQYFPDYRKTLMEIQSSIQNGVLNSSTVTLKSVDIDYDDLFSLIQSKDYTGITEWVVNNSEADLTDIFEKLYKYLKPKVQETAIPALVTILSEYTYKQIMARNQNIHLSACLLELCMIEYKK